MGDERNQQRKLTVVGWGATPTLPCMCCAMLGLAPQPTNFLPCKQVKRIVANLKLARTIFHRHHERP